MIVDAIVTRLTDATTGITIEDGHAAKTADGQRDILPIIYVSPGKTQSGDRAAATRLSQRREMDVVLQMICSITDFDALQAQIDSALLGYQVSSQHEPMAHVEGGPEANYGSVIRFLNVYTTAKTIKQ